MESISSLINEKFRKYENKNYLDVNDDFGYLLPWEFMAMKIEINININNRIYRPIRRVLEIESR